jgi:tubulin-specific chaperone A
MAPPTPLAIATQAVNRLVKEESYYHKEQASQEKRIQKLEEDIKNNSPDLDGNAEYILKQEVNTEPSDLRSHEPQP